MTFVVRAKNTTADNAFAWLLRRNGVVEDGRTIFVGDKRRFEMASPHVLTESFADWWIRRYFDGDVEFEGDRHTAMCVRIGACEFVFFGRV